LMKNKGKIIAFEKNKKRLNMVEDECRRLGINSVETVLLDAAKLCSNYLGIADRILVDAPCSGSGVIRRKPDLKWKNWDNNHLKILNQLQKQILNTAARYLKNGGEILYSTCSMEKEENDDIIAHFLSK
ncbi:MAG: 16S rRNA (cytosine(967)-C(5))-methyltransferase RsmB, partial [Atribacterota bacterium]|nr:16S rRNA (cytosine(967)-C(5))-methyltransferase RsmB [Atribacterota bacterium]